LISPLWKDDGHWKFFNDLAKLREAGKHELVAAVLQMPAVLQSCRSHMEDIIKKNCTTTSYPLYHLLDLQSPLFSELFRFRFGPDRDQFLHLYCKNKDLYMIQKMSQRVDFHSQNKCGLVPFRCLNWATIPHMISLDRNLAAVMLQSDPNCIVGQNFELILQEGFEQFISQTDFAQALFEHIRFRYFDLFQSLYDSCDEKPFERGDYVIGRTKLKQPTQLHQAFVRSELYPIERLIVRQSFNIHVKDGDGRVPFQYADDEILSSLMFLLSTEKFINLMKSDVRTFFRLSFHLLKKKTDWNAIQFLFDHVDLFADCLALV
jgi:hypothetical protein